MKAKNTKGEWLVFQTVLANTGARRGGGAGALARVVAVLGREDGPGSGPHRRPDGHLPAHGAHPDFIVLS
jgi:hypothetical protein